MNRVKFDPATLDGEDKKIWEQWIEKAEKAKQKAIDDFDAGNRPVPFKSEVWAELKKFLLRVVFQGKCAYCDSKYDGHSFGDAEHFRPKSKVTIKKNGKEEVVMVDGEPHPGYYWLAYDWRNLLPACQRCNSEDGKMNQFPVKSKHVAARADGPDTETLNKKEEPLLLHPYREDFDPDAHLLYGDKGVIVAFVSGGQEDAYGRAMIDTCNLKRGELEGDRYESQKYAWLKFKDAMNKSPDDLDQAIAPYESGVLPHSRAALQYVALMWKAYSQKLERLRAMRFAKIGADKDDNGR